MNEQAERFRPGLLVRGRNLAHDRGSESPPVAPRTLVRVACITVLVVLWIVLIVGTAMGVQRDPLPTYWGSLNQQQKVQTCETYVTYPRYAQNALAGAVGFRVSAEEAREWLWRSCG